jgi:hypothetical protein
VARPWPAWWRRVDLTAKRPGQAPVAGVDLGVDVWVSPQQVLDPFGLDRRLVVHPAGPHRPAHSVRPWPSQTVVVLMVFCLRLPEMNARRPQRLARGLLTWVLVPSRRSWAPSAWA